MKTKFLLVAVVPLLVLKAEAQFPYVTNFTYDVNQLIPDGNPNGFASAQEIAGVDGFIGNVTVSLNMSGGYNGDLYVYLTHLSGFSVLLNRVGRTAGDAFGYADAGFNVTFSDSAASDIHMYGGNGGNQVTGTWQPDARFWDPATVLDTTGRSSFLSSFTNQVINGNWTLFIADMSGGGTPPTTLNSWSVSITAVPEPSAVALISLFGGILALTSVRRWRNRDRNRT